MAGKKALMIARTHEYIELHRTSPLERPLNVEAVAAFVPVSRRLFYKKDPEIEALLDLIQPKTPSVPAAAALPTDQHMLGDAALEEQLAQVVSRALWAMQKFVGHHKKGEPVEVALAVHDLDEVIGTLGACQRTLRPLAAEHARRRRQSAGSGGGSVGNQADPSLFDGLDTTLD